MAGPETQIMTGLSTRKNDNGFLAVRLHFSADERKRDPAWKAGERPRYSQWMWDREQEIDFGAVGGKKVYDMFDEDVHTISPRHMPETWTRYRGLDHGLNNPIAVIWAAVDTEQNVYFYREYCKNETPINVASAQIKDKDAGDNIVMTWADPSVMQRTGVSADKKCAFDVYAENGVLLTPGNNRLGFEPVYGYLIAALAKWSVEHEQLHEYFVDTGEAAKHKDEVWKTVKELARDPACWFTHACPTAIEEHKNLRWKKVTNPEEHNPKEKAVDKDDHFVDAVRYVLAAEPRHRSVGKRVAYSRKSSMRKAAY